MYKLIAFIFVIYACSVSGQNQNLTQLTVGLYYGPLCPDSYNFVQNQLGAVYNIIMDYVDIYYVPFGKSESVNEGESFICQHGPPACDASRLQLCSLYLLDGNEPLKAEYVICQMHANSDKTGQECAERVGLDFADVLECFDSYLGTQLQLVAEVSTNLIQDPLDWVPTIAYNYVFDQELQDRSQYDFFNVVCEQLAILENPNVPLECTDIAPYH